MKKYIILCFILLTISGTVFAQTKKVAVYVTGNDISINKVLGDKLVEAFVKNGKYIAVERTNSFLAELKKEQKYQRDGEVSDSEISEVGKQFGVQYVCVAEIYDVYNEKHISARLIDVESVEIINASNVNSKLDNMNELLRVSNDLTAGLTAKTQKEIAEENAAKDIANQELIKKYEAEENQIKTQLDKGILKIEDLYVTFPSDNTKYSWKEAKIEAKACNADGKNDWRIPTELEVKKIYTFIEKKCDNEKYPNIYNEIDHIRDLLHNYGRIEGIWYKELDPYSDRSRRAHLMLVRDAK